MLNSLKSWKFWVLFAVFIVFPQYMVELMPKYAAAWKTIPIIILIFITIYFVTVSGYSPKEDYILFTDLKQILVRFQCGQTIVMKNGNNKIELHIVEGKYLWIQDSKVGGSSVVVREVPQTGRTVHLKSGDFFITRDVTGYVVSWESGDWEVAHILD